MRRSSVGGCRILRCTLSVRPSRARKYFCYRPASSLRTCGILCYCLHLRRRILYRRLAAQACSLLCHMDSWSCTSVKLFLSKHIISTPPVLLLPQEGIPPRLRNIVVNLTSEGISFLNESKTNGICYLNMSLTLEVSTHSRIDCKSYDKRRWASPWTR